MLNASEAAKWFICHNPELASGYIEENTKVNKLLYFSNLMGYCVDHERLIAENFIAFPNGPVVYEVYRDYRYHGLNALPKESPVIVGRPRKILDIVNFVYGGMSAEQLVEESHSHALWKNVRSRIPNNPMIDFTKVEPELEVYYRTLYETYSDMDFEKLQKVKIGGCTYYYDRNEFVMTEEILKQLSMTCKSVEPQFLELVDGELVIS